MNSIRVTAHRALTLSVLALLFPTAVHAAAAVAVLGSPATQPITQVHPDPTRDRIATARARIKHLITTDLSKRIYDQVRTIEVGGRVGLFGGLGASVGVAQVTDTTGKRSYYLTASPAILTGLFGGMAGHVSFGSMKVKAKETPKLALEATDVRNFAGLVIQGGLQVGSTRRGDGHTLDLSVGYLGGFAGEARGIFAVRLPFFTRRSPHKDAHRLEHGLTLLDKADRALASNDEEGARYAMKHVDKILSRFELKFFPDRTDWIDGPIEQ